MFKIICLLVIAATVSVSAKADPKPGVITYSAPVVAAAAPAVSTAYVAPVAAVGSSATVFEQSFHGNFAPLAYSSYPYLTAPLAYSAGYEPAVVAAAAAPATVLLK